MKTTPPAPGRETTSPYGYRINPVTKRYALHRGVDFGGRFTVRAAFEGTITNVAYNGSKAIGFGHNMTITNGNVRAIYAHFEQATLLKKGATVQLGAALATSGSTGASTGTHLHFEIQQRNAVGRWVNVDPAAYLTTASAVASEPITEEQEPNTMANTLVPLTDGHIYLSSEAGHRVRIGNVYHAQLINRRARNLGSDVMGNAELDIVDGYHRALGALEAGLDNSAILEALKRVSGSDFSPVDLSSLHQAIAAVPSKTREAIIRE
jgi:hypothetical protein